MNPYVIVAALIALGFAGFGGYRHGYTTATNEAAAAAKQAQEELIQQHNANAVIDMEAAAAVERERGRRKLAEIQARHTLELDLERRRPPPECRATCDLDSASFELLLNRVRAINAGTSLGSGLRAGGVPAAAGAPGGQLGSGATLSGRGTGAVR